MTALPPCPKCNSEYTYEDGDQLVCPECAHEWKAGENADGADDARVIKDSVGNLLQDGDTITVIKDLKVKGSSLVVKVGTKVKNIRLVDGDHDIDCKIDGIGAMKLKSSSYARSDAPPPLATGGGRLTAPAGNSARTGSAHSWRPCAGSALPAHG